MEFLVLFVAVAVLVALYVIVYQMAAERGRNGCGWLLGALLFNPFGAMFLLVVLGDAEK